MNKLLQDKAWQVGDSNEMVNDRRLNIAAQMMGHIIQSGFYSLAEKYRDNNISEMTQLAMQLTDTLIAECEKKGGQNGNI